MPLEECLTESSIEEDIEQLSDSSISIQEDREQVNGLVAALVSKYFLLYLDINHLSDDIRYQIGQRLMYHFYGINYAAQCVADMRTTAAIVKEIIFNERFDGKGNFVGVDAGVGTGVLSVAMIIAAQRKKMPIEVIYGFDNIESNIQTSRKLLSQLFPKTNIEIEECDISEPGLIEDVEMMAPITYLVSETFNSDTPYLTDHAENRFDSEVEFPDSKNLPDHDNDHRKSDPFEHVFMNLVKEIPDFEQRVISGRSAMFPDIFNGLYYPNGDNSLLRLDTGDKKHRPLHEVGSEFPDVENYGFRGRWGIKS